MKKLTLVLVLTVFMSGCGGGGGGITPPPTSNILVSISPASQTTIDQGQTVDFSASLTHDTTGVGVKWSASGAGCTGNACGTFTNVTTTAARYNAPPSVTNSSSVTVTATSVADSTKSAASTVVLTPAPHINTLSLPNATPADYYPAQNYSVSLQASGGVGALTWSLTGGSLPTGLQLTSSGIISGTPTSTSTAAATSNFTVQVADQSQATSGPLSAHQAFSITVMGVLTVTTTMSALPIGTVGSAYSAPIESAGGTLPITWSLVRTSGSLPSGLTLQGTSNTSSTQIYGTPTVPGNYTFQVQAVDRSTPPQTTPPQTLEIVVTSSPLAITTRALPNGTAGVPYNAQLVAIGGTPPYTWTQTGAPTTWLTFPPTGVLSGTNPSVGQSNFSVTVTDAALATASQSLSLNINPAPAAACPDSGSESLLNGQYAFSLSGYNAAASFLTVVGSLTADGKGNITGGEADTNGALGAQASPTASGSYSVGANNLGCATIATSFGTFVTRFALGSISANVAAKGRIIEWDSPNSSAYIAAGQILQQASGSFLSGLSGSYVFRTAGWDISQSGGRTSCLGYMVFNVFVVSGAEQDCNDAGIISNPVPGASPPPGTYSNFDSNGRATMIASVVSNTGTSTFHFTLYMVTNSELLVVTSDPYPAQGGEMLSQRVPTGSSGFTQRSLNGNTVFYLTGESGGGSESAASLNLAVADDVNSNLTVTSYADYQGTWLGGGTPPIPQFTCPYTVERSGRVTVTCAANNPNGYTSLYLYLTDLNTGFLVDTLPGVDMGSLVPQTIPTGGISALAGTFFSSLAEAVNQEIGSNSVNEITLSAGSVNGISDSTSTSNQTADQTYTDTYTNLPSNGTFMAHSSSNTFVGVILNSHMFVMFDPSSITTPNPILLIVEQ